MDLYAENILDHYRSPRNAGALASPTVQHQEQNISCGDEITLWLTLENDIITDIGWTGTGCAISQAGMSLLSELLRGKRREEALKLSKDDLYALLGVPIGPRRFKCALLCLHTLKNALLKAKGDNLLSWTETVAISDE